MSRLLRKYIQTILESARITQGDIAQKKVAAWFIQQRPEIKAFVNAPGSGNTDVLLDYLGDPVHVEVKSDKTGNNIYSHELTLGSNVADFINYKKGSVEKGLSLTRFIPAESGKPIESPEKIRAEQNKIIDEKLSKKSDFYEVLFGGTGISSLDQSKRDSKLTQEDFIKTLSVDGSMVQRHHLGYRRVLIVIKPGDAGEVARLRFWAEGSSRLRSAAGGRGKQSLGSIKKLPPSVEEKEAYKVYNRDLTEAWRKDFITDHYFAIVSGNLIRIGKIRDEDPLGLGLPLLSVQLSSTSGAAMAFGGPNISGIREKVIIEVIGAKDVEISQAAVQFYENSGLILSR